MNAKRIYLKNRAAWRKWLAKNHTQNAGVWLVYDKAPRTMTYDDMLEEALCFGWIDSTVGTVSATQAKSNWSKRNKGIIARLVKAKLMQPAGKAMVILAKKTGTWDALNEVENLVVPPDLAKALKGKAKVHFDAFPRSEKRAILEWLLNAKKPETRTARITKAANAAANNARLFS